MFRFTQWMPADYNWSRWLKWFRRSYVLAEVVRCGDPGYPDEAHECRHAGSHSAVFREGEEVITPEALEQRHYVALRRAKNER